MGLRIGSVPYLNAKPLVDWFHSPGCHEQVEVVYAVPSRLAKMLRCGEVDVCNCSIYESLRAPGLAAAPGISISSNGPVMSVRLFCKKPPSELRTVALDTSSMTSSALTRIVLEERYNARPEYVNATPDLEAMLLSCDAGLIIGDLKLFDLHAGAQVLDLGEEWQQMTHLPFVYAAWQCPLPGPSGEMVELLTRAKEWGVTRLDELAHRWSGRLGLPESRCLEYFTHAMDYDLTPRHVEGLEVFRRRCVEAGLIDAFSAVHVADFS